MLDFVILSTEEKQKILGAINRYLQEVDLSLTPMEISYGMNEIIQRETGIEDPLKDLKRESNEKAQKLVKKAREIIKNSSDPIYTAIKIAISGNIIDFGVKTEYNLVDTLDEVLKDTPLIDDYNLLKEKLNQAETLTFLADNAGEIVLDKLLIETLVSTFSFKKIFLIVKKYPFGNDVTPEDLENLDFEKISNLEIVALDNLSTINYPDQIKPFIEETDLTISKGQGNFELLYGKDFGLFFLFIVKCKEVGQILSAKNGSVILIFE
jgi:uncharacterized protein with ATP-grasp and redox domains